MRGFWRYSYPVPTSVFISYAHTDRAHKDEIVKHLRSLHHAFDVQPWSDEQIGVGSVYREEIRSALDAASVAILLISVDALNSTFISEEELPHLLARRRAEGLLLIPVLVRECAWRENPWLEGLQVLNPVPLAVMSEPEREGQLARLAEHVRAHVVIRSTGPTPSAAPNARTRAARARPTLNPHNVDRDAELAIFLSLFGPDATDRVLVISGASSMGKTWFLRKCHVHLPHESTVAWIDLKNLELSIPDIILRVSENWDHGADLSPHLVSRRFAVGLRERLNQAASPA